VSTGLYRHLPALLIIATLAVASPGRAQGDDLLTGTALLEALRAGGHNIYFRHAQTDWSQDDHIDKAGDWTSCDPARVRQLSAQGRRVSTAIGAAMRALGIPVGRVLASPYCRTVETARLLDLGPVTTTTDVMNLRVADFFGGTEVIVKRARARLTMRPAAGTNTVLVAHGNVAREATPVYPDEAEAVIFRPAQNSDFVLVGRLQPAQWMELLSPGANGRTPRWASDNAGRSNKTIR